MKDLSIKEDEITEENAKELFDETMEMITKRTLLYRKCLHNAIGTVLALIGGTVGLVSVLALKSAALFIIGMLVAFAGTIEAYTSEDIAENDVSGRDKLLHHATKLAKEDEVTAKLLELSAASATILNNNLLSNSEEPSVDDTVETTKIEPMKQPQLTHNDDKVRRRKKDR